MATQQYTKRNQELEGKALDRLVGEINKSPFKFTLDDWDKVAEYAYGPGYTVREGTLRPPTSQIPDNPDKIGQKIKYPALSPTLTEWTPDGGFGLVKFQEDPDAGGPANINTVFLFDKANKTLRPFVSEQAFNTYFAPKGLTLEKVAQQGLIYLAPNSLLSNNLAFSPERGYSVLTRPEEHIQNNGMIPSSNKISTDKIAKLYGQAPNPQAVKDALNFLGGNGWATPDAEYNGLLDLLKKDPNSGISAETIDRVASNQDGQNTIYLYANALVFGGYEVTDIIRDLKRLELLKQGDTSMQGIKIIDESLPADKYYNTPAGKVAFSNPNLELPDYLGNFRTDDLEYTIYNMPDEVFKTLVPPIDWTTPEAKEEASNIQAAYYDVLMKQLDAKTEQEKAVADYLYQKFKDNINEAHGWKLSDNAMEAWNQLQNMTTNMSGRGLEGSGIHNEMMDKYLRDVREKDERLRTQKMEESEAEKMNYYRSYATSEEIAQLSPEEKQKWGLTPSDKTKQWFNLANLQAEYPNTPVEELKRYRELVIDPSSEGYRSNLYQNLFANKAGLEGWLTEPTMGKEQYQMNKLMENQALAEEKRYKEYTTPDSAFSKDGYTGDLTSQTEASKPVSSTPQTTYGPASSPYFGIPTSETTKPGFTEADAKKYWEQPDYIQPQVIQNTTTKLPQTGAIPPNPSNPFFGISQSETGKDAYPQTEEEAKEYWRKKGYTKY